jgi:uncharacterized SAM-binding protein YcdF (DUF218 family)
MLTFKKIATMLLLPPTGPLLMVLLGLWMTRRQQLRLRKGGITLAVISVLLLLLLSIPFVSRALVAPLEPYPPMAASQLRQVQAIVILGGGTYHGAPEYGGDTVGGATLERIRYGAYLARQSNLPLLVTGGAPNGGRAEAVLMAETLEREFGVKVRWVESLSRDTNENAVFSAPLLKIDGVKRIALISHCLHLPRSISLFEKQGLEVVPAPTGFSTRPPSMIANLLPNGLGRSSAALHEYLGILFNVLFTH